MPTRRVMELVVVTVIPLHICLSMAKLWATKTLGESTAGSPSHVVASVVSVLS